MASETCMSHARESVGPRMNNRRNRQTSANYVPASEAAGGHNAQKAAQQNRTSGKPDFRGRHRKCLLVSHSSVTVDRSQVRCRREGLPHS